MLETHSETDRSVRAAEAAAAPAARRRRPFGINVIIVLLLIDFVASAIAGVTVPLMWSMIPTELRQEVGIATAFGVATGIASPIIAFGLWRLRRWAWYGVMILTGISLLAAIWQYFRGAQPYPDLLLNAVIAFYLNQREVQSRFVAVQPKEPPL